jgi:hypothetical protein
MADTVPSLLSDEQIASTVAAIVLDLPEIGPAIARSFAATARNLRLSQANLDAAQTSLDQLETLNTTTPEQAA